MFQEWKVTLNTGAKMPAFGLGTALCKPGEVGAAVEAALKAGYHHIDCAHVYANEGEVGEALQKCFKEGVVKREDIFVTSKLGSGYQHDPLAAIQVTLKNLQLDYLDLYLVHAPWPLRKGVLSVLSVTEDDKLLYSSEAMAECWRVMEECYSKGLTKAIGISNFTITKTENLLKTAKVVPAINQVECHPYLQQQKLKDYCDSKGIILEAYAPLGCPARPWKQDSDPVVLEDPVIKEIAAKHGATAAQVCIAFPLHRGLVVLAKTVNLKRVPENLKSTELKLDAEDMRKLRELEKNYRLFQMGFFAKSGTPWQALWDIEEDEKYEVK